MYIERKIIPNTKQCSYYYIELGVNVACKATDGWDTDTSIYLKTQLQEKALTMGMLPNEFGKKFNGRLSYEKHCWSIKAPREENTNIIRSLCFSIWCHVVSSSSHIFICNSLLGCFSAATSLGRSSRLDNCLEKLVVEDSDPFVLQKRNQIDVV